jgi:hypothetical protein
VGTIEDTMLLDSEEEVEDFSRPGVSMSAGSSSGRVHRIGNARDENDYAYLASDCEFATYLYFYFSSKVANIATQVDCEPGQTRRIALELGIEHPKNRRKRPWMISTDLLVTFVDNGKTWQEAVNVKHRAFDVSERRFRNLCSIEARYHHERGAKWWLCRSNGLNTNWARNYLWLYPAADDFYRSGLIQEQVRIRDLFLRRLRRPRGAHTVRDLCRMMTESDGLETGAAVSAYRSLLATQTIWCDMNVEDLLLVPPGAVTPLQPGLS